MAGKIYDAIAWMHRTISDLIAYIAVYLAIATRNSFWRSVLVYGSLVVGTLLLAFAVALYWADLTPVMGVII